MLYWITLAGQLNCFACKQILLSNYFQFLAKKKPMEFTTMCGEKVDHIKFLTFQSVLFMKIAAYLKSAFLFAVSL